MGKKRKSEELRVMADDLYVKFVLNLLDALKKKNRKLGVVGKCKCKTK